jgi:hypothetical protein
MLAESEKVQLVLKVEPDVRQQLRIMAKREGRSVSGQLSYLVRQETKRRMHAAVAEATAQTCEAAH